MQALSPFGGEHFGARSFAGPQRFTAAGDARHFTNKQQKKVSKV
jgi:hypothetical protein